MQRLVVVQDEDVAAKGVDTGRVDRGILGNGIGPRRGESDYNTQSLEQRFLSLKGGREKGAQANFPNWDQ